MRHSPERGNPKAPHTCATDWIRLYKGMASQYHVHMFAVYILANKMNGTVYTGMTNDLKRRVWEHKQGLADGFTKKYEIHHLVYYEAHQTAESAIVREKQIKHWNRLWKLKQINEFNPEWNDLYAEL